jgi:hypothetical protein
VNSYTTGDQVWPTVAAGADGAFDVAWAGPGDGHGTGIFGPVSREQMAVFIVATFGLALYGPL